MLHCPCLSSVRQRTSPRSRPGHSSHTTGRTWLGKARARSERAVIAVVPLCCESQRRRGQRSEVCAHSLTARMGVCSSAVMDGGNSGRSWLWLWLKWCWRWWWPQQCGANVREPRSARDVWQAHQVCMCVGPASGGRSRPVSKFERCRDVTNLSHAVSLSPRGLACSSAPRLTSGWTASNNH